MTFVDHELWTRLTMSHLIVGGVFDRHPDLQVVWTEMPGLRWVVEELERMTSPAADRAVALRGRSRGN